MRLKQKVIKDLSMFVTRNIKLFTFTCALAPRWHIGPHEYQITTYFFVRNLVSILTQNFYFIILCHMHTRVRAFTHLLSFYEE